MNILKVRKVMDQEGIVFSFFGMISQSLTEFMIETAEKQFEAEGHDKKSIKSMFFISIEMLQNVMTYSKERLEKKGNRYTSPGILIVGFDDVKQKYFVNTSNEIEQSDQEKITKKLDMINSLDEKEQRKLLRKKLKTAEDSHARGAGVGFIEMAKRSSEKLEYTFEKLDDKLFFHIKAYV